MQRGLCRSLTPRESEAIALRRGGATLAEIAAALDVSGRRAHQLVKAASNKIEQERAVSAFANPLDCPIEMLPIPANRRRPLLQAGYTLLRDLVRLTDEQLLHIPGIGRVVVDFIHSFR